MNSAIKKITGGFTALFLSLGLALSYPVQALELRFVLPSPDFSKEQKKDQGQILKFEPVQEQEDEDQVVKIDLVVKDKKIEEAEKPEKPVKAQPRIIILKFQLPKEPTDEKLQELQKQIVKLKEAIAKLTPQPKAVTTALNDINGLKLPVVEAVEPPAAEPPEPPEEYSLAIDYQSGASSAGIWINCTRLCDLVDRVNGTTYAKNLKGENIVVFITVNPLQAKRPVLRTMKGNIVLPQKGAQDIGPVTAGTFAAEPLVITTASLPDGSRGIGYDQTLEATGGGGPPYTWSIVSGSLPPAITLEENGRISGLTGTPGSYEFTVRVQAAILTRDKEFSITITGS